jgi:aryl-phospho-beta-D-glucosidase BglC (GH1 family)
MFSSTFLTALFTLAASPVLGWLPGEQKEIYAADGTNLFNATSVSNSTNSNITARWLPYASKIRGVNLGSLFVIEPWMASTEWNNMGCGGQVSEFDCVSYLGQSQANSVFQNHWNTWITQGDIQQMQSYGLNTIRIPVGYWMMESIVYNSEHFPQGAVPYLERVCGWAADVGFYIIIDMHGAPGAQVATNPFTGQVRAMFNPAVNTSLTQSQYAPSPGFYVDYQYSRAEQFLSWLTHMIHTNNNFRNVGMIEVVNEPVQDANYVSSMRSDYYPNAYNVRLLPRLYPAS